MRDKTFGLKPVLLIVDDQVTDLRILSTAVRDLADVYIAKSGQEAYASGQVIYRAPQGQDMVCT
jgi:CheY-like chemotaxis protein